MSKGKTIGLIRKLRKILVRVLLVFLVLCVLGTVILSLPGVQTKIAQSLTKSINKEYGTNINVDRVRISLITWDTALDDIYIEDYQKDTLAFIDELSTSILNFKDLAQGNMELGDIEVEGLFLNLKTYKGQRRTNLDHFIAKLDDGQPRKPGTPPFYFYSGHVDIVDSRFRLWDENLEHQKILDFKDLNIVAEDFKILGPEVSVSIQDMNLNTSRGLALQHMTTDFSYSLEQMRFDAFKLQTPESELKGAIHFNYEIQDLGYFLDSVNLDVRFEDSRVSLDEINSFYDQFGSGKVVNFSSEISGTLNEMQVSDLLLFTDNTGVRGDFLFENLFEREDAFRMDGDIRNITTNYYELRSLLPNFLGTLPRSMQKLGSFTVRGQSEITTSMIDAKVNLTSSLGSSYIDLVLTNIENINNADYTGFVSLIDFDLGRFANVPSLGKTTLDVNVEGSGFLNENLNTEVIGEVYSIVYNQYEYNDIDVSGVLKEQLYDGSLVSQDENFKFNFKGLADFGREENNFNFIASVDYADLFALNFIEDTVAVFKGNVAMNINGNNLDNIRGDIQFSETNYQNANNTYYFDDFAITSSFATDSVRTIEINSPDIITGYMRGKFKVRELGKLVQNSIGSIYTNYRPYEISEGQQLAFNFKIYNKIVDVFFPEVVFDPNTFIRGNIVADEGDFKLNFKSPNIEAYGNVLKNIDIKIDNKNPLFNTYMAVEDVSTVYYDVKDFNLINTTLKDTLFFRTEFKGGSEYNDSYNLNFYHTFNEKNQSVIGLKKSDVNFKGNTWVLNREGNDRNKVILNRTLDSIKIEEIVMNNEVREEIVLNGELADSTYKDLTLRFKIVSLDKITPAIDSLQLSGEINGMLNIRQEDDVYLPVGNLNIADFGVNGAELGQLDIGIVGNRDLTEFQVNTQITDNGLERFSVIGTVENRGAYPQADLVASFNQFQLEPFNPLGEGVIDQIRGTLEGRAQIRGDIRNPDISGLLTLNDAGLGIPYLNVNYDFGPNSVVRLFNQTFDFQNIRLIDTAERTRATLDGTITHSFFDDWTLNLGVDTEDDRFLILNTEFDEEELYYGQAFVNGEGSITGLTTELNISFEGSSARGTSLKIPLSDVASIGDYSFVNFIEKDQRTAEEIEQENRRYGGLELEFDLDVTPDAEIEIVTDRQTGSSLKGTGAGLIFMEINTNGKFNMYGDFVVVTGSYNYRYGGIIDRTFDVRPDGRITWTGEPLEAQIDMEAIYNLNANPAPLLNNDRYSRPIPTEVVVRLSGELEQPTIDFDIEFPGTSSIIKSELEYALQDPTVEERNAIFLLAQGTFVAESGGFTQQAITGNLIQSASSLVNSALGSNNDKFDLGFSYEQGYNGPLAEGVTDDRIGVTVSTQISDRVLFNGRFGVPVSGVSETVVAGDVEVQVLLNDEGTLSARIFNRQNEIQQFLQDIQYTQGVGLSYEVDFNSFKDLLNRIFKSKSNPEQGPAPAPSGNSQGVIGNDSLVKFYTKTKKPEQ